MSGEGGDILQKFHTRWTNRLFKALSFKKKEIFPHIYADARGNISFFCSTGSLKEWRKTSGEGGDFSKISHSLEK